MSSDHPLHDLTEENSPPLATVLNILPEPVIIQTPAFHIIFANKAARSMMHEVCDKQGEQCCACHMLLFQLEKPCATYGLPCPLQKALTSRQTARVIREQKGPDGQFRALEIKAQPIFDQNDEIVQIIETFQDISSSRQISQAMERYSHCQEAFFLASRRITSSSDLKKLYRHIVSHTMELLDFDFSTLMLLSEDKKGLIFRDTIGFPASTINSLMIMEGQGLATYVAKTQKADVVLDFQCEDRFEIPDLVRRYNIRSALCVPMIIADQVLGVLVGHTLKQRVFTDFEILLYGNLANQAAMALYSADALSKLQASEDRLHDLFENSMDLIQMIGPDSRFLYVNKSWKKNLGYTDDEIKQLNVFDIIHPDNRAHCRDLFRQLCRGEQVELTETIFVTKSGHSFPVEGHMNSHIRNGKLISTRGIFRNVTERKLFEEKLKTQSITDELTGLLNRRGFFAMAEKQLAISARTGDPLWLLYADLDNMKWINDNKGHKAGDQTLKDTAQLLTETFRDGDIIARVGGDEFTVLLTAIATGQDQERMMARFTANLERLNTQKDRDYELLISTGVALYNGKPPCLLEDLMSRADNLMYENKRQRKLLRQARSQPYPPA